ncbi:MAG: BREX-2 system adenine-specific DNA-methyltransferase PglX [Solirubrobacteraceae bacterium]
MIDRTALLATLKPVVGDLENSIRERALATPEVAAHLELEHRKAVKSDRTAMSLEEWREGEITQAAVAWILACVFIRFLEDNRLIDQPLISGPGPRGTAALGHRSVYFQREPGHSDREYLESCFREVAAFPAVAPLYDERHNPLWRLGPTADGARALRETFTQIDPGTGDLVRDFTDPALDTRFLGDLYQDLSDTARKRYALLQTPDFVERFILDRTLTPAIDEFGLEEVRLIDPTCGSGHFLIGAFERLFALWNDREAGTEKAVIAQRCLAQLAGVDLNPYAIAIARFRLVVVALRCCNIARVAEAPALHMHLATGDSLLHGPLPQDGATMLFDANRLDKNIAHVFDSEDAAELKRILGRGYHAVVGNPPYITGDDAAMREAYRIRYSTCRQEFALTVPFMERFFELACVADGHGRLRAGFVGKITANSFLRRAFGVALVEEFLPTKDVHQIVDTSRAGIPGHVTPTLILFGRARRPNLDVVQIVEAIRGEAGRGGADRTAWEALVDLADSTGGENALARASLIDRSDLARHPVAIGPGRALRLKIERGAKAHVEDKATDLGYSGQTNLDDVFVRSRGAWHRARVPESLLRPFTTGTDVADWTVSNGAVAWFPYSGSALLEPELLGTALRAIWPWREVAWGRRTFSKRSYREEGRAFYEWHQLALQRHQTDLFLVWAYKSTTNLFALARGGAVFNRHAPFVKLQDESVTNYLLIAAVVNSALAAFLLKLTCQDTGLEGYGEAWEPRYEFSSKGVGRLPLPHGADFVRAASIDAEAMQRSTLVNTLLAADGSQRLSPLLDEISQRDSDLLMRMISGQEELDWSVLAAFGLLPDELAAPVQDAPPIALGERAFEIVLARQVAAGEIETGWFERHGSTPITEVPAGWPAEYREVVERRIDLIENDADIGLIERPEHKRRWNRAPWEDRKRDALATLVLDALEAPEVWADLRPWSTAELTDHLRRTPLLVEVLELLADRKDADLGATVTRLVLEASVPHPAAQRLNEKGLTKRVIWERVWALQRAEDRDEEVGIIPVPTKYAEGDFRSSVYWRLRGKFDVPKERFVLIPNAQRGADACAVVGWAGWDERGLARALAGRITELREEDAADAQCVTPLLAGVLELLPWIHQWHPESDPLYAGPPGAFFEGWLDGQLAELSITRDTLRTWRPPAPTRGRKAKVTAA